MNANDQPKCVGRYFTDDYIEFMRHVNMQKFYDSEILRLLEINRITNESVRNTGRRERRHR